MSTPTFGAAIALLLATCGATALAHPRQAPPAESFAWADSCRKCHQPVYEAWARTKHATALGRLSAAEQTTECAGCHLTGSATRVVDGGKVLNAGIQCEACH